MQNEGGNKTTIARLVAAMPKVELHVHLEGCLTPELAFDFARRNRIFYPFSSIAEARAGTSFSDLASFIAAMNINTEALRTVDDYYELTREYVKRARAENIIHAEIAFSPQGCTRRGLETKPCVEAIASALREGRDEFGLTGGIIAGIVRHRPPDEGMAMLRELRGCGDAVLGVGFARGRAG